MSSGAAARIARHFTGFSEEAFDAEMARSAHPSTMDVAIHEAGHAVAYLHLGIDLDYVTLDVANDDEGRLGYVAVQDESVLDHMEGYLIATLAGPAASKKWNPDFYWKPSIRDRQQFWEHAEDKSETHIRYLETCADNLVEKYWLEIETVAAFLADRRTLSVYEVRDLMGVL